MGYEAVYETKEWKDLQYQLDRLKERLYNLEEKVEALRIATGKSFYINTGPTGKYTLKDRDEQV